VLQLLLAFSDKKHFCMAFGFFSCKPGVNFINVKRTNFLYERRFDSFFYLHVTVKKAAEVMFIRKTRGFNVDEIDGWFDSLYFTTRDRFYTLTI
jgi:hypothetical protein